MVPRLPGRTSVVTITLSDVYEEVKMIQKQNAEFHTNFATQNEKVLGRIEKHQQDIDQMQKVGMTVFASLVTSVAALFIKVFK